MKNEILFIINQSLVGTPQWLAPEIGEGEVFTKAADVFSFGVVMWEISTRQLPYANENLINPSIFMAQIAKVKSLFSVSIRFRSHTNLGSSSSFGSSATCSEP